MLRLISPVAPYSLGRRPLWSGIYSDAGANLHKAEVGEATVARAAHAGEVPALAALAHAHLGVVHDESLGACIPRAHALLGSAQFK